MSSLQWWFFAACLTALSPVLLAASTNCTSGSVSCPCIFSSQWNGTIVTCVGLGLTEIPKNFPGDLVGLQLSNNSLTHIDSDDFDNYPDIVLFMADYNNLVAIDDAAFKGLVDLEYLILNNNPSLATIPALDTSLEELDLAYTAVGTVQSNFDLSDLPGSLETLKLDGNKLTSWPYNFPIKITYLSLSDNQLTTIGDLSSVSLLGHLDLSKNEISSLSGQPELPISLAKLILDFNPIDAIDSDYLHNLEFIEYLTISNAEVDEISTIAFQGLSPHVDSTSRIELDFDFSPNLEAIYEETFDPFFYADTEYAELTLGFEGAGLNCECGMVWIPTLLTNMATLGIAPQKVTFQGTCHSPPDLAGKNLQDLTVDEIQCPDNSGGGDDSDDAAKNAAIVMGVLLALVIIGGVMYFLYQRVIRGNQYGPI